MSTETQATPNENVVQSQPTKKRSRLLGGCGCVLLVALILGIGSYYVFSTFQKPFSDFEFEHSQLAIENPVIKELLGEDVEEYGMRSKRLEGTSYQVEIPLKGSLGSGRVVATGTWQEDWTITEDEFYLLQGEDRISIDPDEGLMLEIE